MVIDSELGPRKSPTAQFSSGMRGAIGLSWFMPILYAVTTLLIYTVMGEWPKNWWMTVNTIGFALFIIIETLFVILFSLLFYTLIHKLSYIAKKHDKHGILISKRYANHMDAIIYFINYFWPFFFGFHYTYFIITYFISASVLSIGSHVF